MRAARGRTRTQRRRSREFVMRFVFVAARMFRSHLLFALTVFSAIAYAGGAHAQTSIRFLLDSKIDGTSTPFLLAIDKGYFKAEGLDVTVLEPASFDLGESEEETIKRIASGDVEMGFGDINAMIKFWAQHPQMPLKAVYIVHNKAAYSVVGRKSRGLTYPKDLEGKRLGAPLPDQSFAQWKIFVQANALDESKIGIENSGKPVREA